MTQPGPLGSSYHLESLLGRGASGEVWRGRDAHGNPWAFKILRPELASDSTVLRRFIQERDVLASIRHPNVVQVHDLVLDGSALAIVVDLVDGMDLKAVLRSRGSLPPALVARIGAEVAAGLAAAHALGVVHRDVKPENVLMAGGEAGQARLTDFGVAKLVGEAGGSTMVLGTPQYMPPEFGEGQAPTAAGDLYSLGIMLYELLCGVTPFAGRGPAMAVLRAHAAESPGRPDGVPDALWDIVAELTQKAPHRRPHAASVVADRLASLVAPLDGLLAAPALTSPPPTTPVPVDETLYGEETRLRPAYSPPGAPEPGEPGSGGPYSGGPYTSLPGGPYSGGPSASLPGAPYSGGPYSGGPYSGGPGYVVPAGGGSGSWSAPPGAPIGTPPPGSFAAAPYPPQQARPPRRSGALVAAAVVGALLLVAGTVFGISRLRPEPETAAATATSTPGSAPQSAAQAGAAAPSTSTMVVTVTGQPQPAAPPAAVAPPAPAAPPQAAPPPPAAPPADGPGAGHPGYTPGSVVTGMGGTSCRLTDEPTGYGSYPKSICDSMRRYQGADGAILNAGRTWVVCQQDLGIANPVYVRGQTNTWWFFTRSDNRRWAWFPHTLLKQGAADLPINGIPLCG